ncbi:metallophosphoesterase family protein [Gymnodinialimonas ceratoperidinii]|uniref:Serine/threonine protein phosphatase n=1 Tax=Gymnodinialimonas ceratoperidinii TaxID=2856823 RepID=A0A8F6TZ32_9RHOB|nr:metallophosphoesterase family protein [Gymnodinialimonas ceratoperidinii]QXT40578.1 serine/threonine protein phosphatase [Gymnodinialimonas ceratoperidinii]
MRSWDAPAPAELVYVVGDVHGCVDKLHTLLTRIDMDAGDHAGGSGKVVFVGDYIDRGEASADVLRFLAEMTADFPERIVALMGNHERMMLDFLADPTGAAKRWLRYGGLQTLASFGVGAGLTTDSRNAGDLLDAAGDLREAMGTDLVDWIKNLPLSWSTGTLWVTHAGADPDLAMSVQKSKALLWGADTFLSQERTDGQWVAFGHQPFETPFAEQGRIAVDTGAVYGGVMTAARVDPSGDVRFLQS